MRLDLPRRLLLVVALLTLAFTLSSCGGGGGGGGDGGTPPEPPFIFAELDSFPPGSAPAGFTTNAFVTVLNDSTGASITTATVTMNGVTLAYNAGDEAYEGTVAVAPGAAVTVSVTVGSSTYTASATQFTSYPTVSTPAPGDTWTPGVANNVMWSGGSPTTGASYALGVLDAADPNAPLVWPLDHFLQDFPIGTTSFSIPAGSVPAGNRLVIVGISKLVNIPNAAPLSSLFVSGFNFVPITVAGMPVTSRVSGTTNALNGITWSGTQFVAVGQNGAILTSPNGITWTSRVSGTTDSLFAITWSGTQSQFVAVGGKPPLLGVDPGHGTILTSSDGVTWTSRTSGTTSPLRGVVWSGAVFVATGDFGAILTSPDGITWTSQTSGTRHDLNGVAWSGADFIVVGSFGFNSSGIVLSSTDGITWGQRHVNPQTGPPFDGLLGVAWSGAKFVAVGVHIYTAPSGGGGVDWSQQTSGTTNLLSGVAWAGTQFVAVGANGTMLTSPDGVTWSLQASGTASALSGVAWSGTNVVMVGANGTIVTSP